MVRTSDFIWVRDHMITLAKVWELDQRDNGELEAGETQEISQADDLVVGV